VRGGRGGRAAMSCRNDEPVAVGPVAAARPWARRSRTPRRPSKLALTGQYAARAQQYAAVRGVDDRLESVAQPW
jgi:hypothetical protein